MNFADLHRHLDGSLRFSTVVELAALRGVTIPEPLEFQDGMGLEQALARFSFTLGLLQEPEVVARVAAEICEDAEVEGVTTLEIRFAPQLHLGATIEVIVDAALEGIAGRAGLILCGLYGEHPDVLGRLVETAVDRPGVVGLDLAGAPRRDHRYRLEDYADVFQSAGHVGLGRTVHAGEGRPAREIGVAIERLGANRIGHGLTILDDPDVVALARERGVTLEACVTSNRQTGAIATAADHPLPRWIEAGLRACVCTDNTLFSAVDAREEHRRVAQIPGMDLEKLETVVRHGHEARSKRPSTDSLPAAPIPS